MRVVWRVLWLLLVLVGPLAAAEYSGKVIAISDGDTLTLLTAEKQQVKVRLGEIDTPESGQPYGARAKMALSDLVFGKQVRVVVQDTDRYGRKVCRVFVGATDVNAELVKQGVAWVYRQYAKDQSLYRLEEQAKLAKRGLWALPESERCAPWNWRRGTCNAVPASPAVTGKGGLTCGDKRYCRQMTSCEEATFYLKTCGVSSLDGNKDGVPCEALCR
jgi:endonuclease YncB( thermonuclease family)